MQRLVGTAPSAAGRAASQARRAAGKATGSVGGYCEAEDPHAWMEGRTEKERRAVRRLIRAEAYRVAQWRKAWAVPPPSRSREVEWTIPEMSLPTGWIGDSLDEDGKHCWVQGSWDCLPRGWDRPDFRPANATILVRSVANFVAPSPCNRFVLCFHGEDDRAGSLVVHTAADGAVVATVNSVAPYTMPVWHPGGKAVYFTTRDKRGGGIFDRTLSQLRLDDTSSNQGACRPGTTALFSTTAPSASFCVADLRCQHGALSFRVGRTLFAAPLTADSSPFPVHPPRYSLDHEGATAEVAEPIGLVARVSGLVDILCDGEAWYCLQDLDDGLQLDTLPMVMPQSPPSEDDTAALPAWQPLASVSDALWSVRAECPAPGNILLLGNHYGTEPRLHWLRRVGSGDADPVHDRAGDEETFISLSPEAEAEGWRSDPVFLPTPAQSSQLLFSGLEGHCVPAGQGHHPTLLSSRRVDAPDGLWRVRGPWDGEGRTCVLPVVAPGPAELASNREWRSVETRDGDTVDVLLTWHGPAALHGRPVLLEVYGCYEKEPNFAGCNIARALVFDHGAVHARACVRGEGARNDEAWGRHKAVAARDVVDVARECRRSLQPSAMACMAASGGGIVAGAALNEDPSIFDAVLLQSAYLDVVRQQGREDAPVAVATRIEFGDLLHGDEEEVEAVLALAPMRNVHPTTPYPPTLVQQGQLDELTPGWEALKWVTTLRQQAVAGSGPFGAHVYLSLGHSLHEDKEEEEACTEEAISFLASHLAPHSPSPAG